MIRIDVNAFLTPLIENAWLHVTTVKIQVLLRLLVLNVSYGYKTFSLKLRKEHKLQVTLFEMLRSAVWQKFTDVSESLLPP
jgi:hypothetical protein